MKKVVLGFLAVSMGIFSLVGVSSAYATDNTSEAIIVQYDRTIRSLKC